MSNQNLFNSFSGDRVSNNFQSELLFPTEDFNSAIVSSNETEELFQFGTPTTPAPTAPTTPTTPAAPTAPTTPTAPAAPTAPTTIIPPVDPGTTLADAYDLGVLNGSLNVQETVGGTDQGDLYQFTVSTAGEYSFSLDGLSGDVDLGILDASGNVIASSTTEGTASEVLSGNLTEGTYYLGVASYDGVATSYSLNLTNGSSPATPTNPTTSPTQDPGDTLDTAYDLGLFSGSGSVVLQDAVGSSDPVDAYQFSVDQSNEFSFTVDGLSGNVDLGIYDGNGELLATSENVGTEAEILSGTLTAGTYYLGVVSYDGVDTSYDLTIAGGDQALASLSVETGAEAMPVVEDFSLV